MSGSKNVRRGAIKVSEHRARLRAEGLRPVQIWVPDMRSAASRGQAQLQSLAVARSAQAGIDQDFIDTISQEDIE